jgi:hypothetical protein
MPNYLVTAVTVSPFLLSLGYLKAPRIATQLPNTQASMSIGYYEMQKPTPIDSTYRSRLMVDGSSRAEVECMQTSLLPANLAEPRVLFNGYEPVCLTNAWVLPKPIGSNLLKALPRMSAKNISRRSLPGYPVQLTAARFSYGHIKQQTGTHTGIITTSDGSTYEANLDQAADGVYTDIIVKGSKITSYRRLKQVVPAAYCINPETGKDANIPFDAFDLRKCFR